MFCPPTQALNYGCHQTLPRSIYEWPTSTPSAVVAVNTTLPGAAQSRAAASRSLNPESAAAVVDVSIDAEVS